MSDHELPLPDYDQTPLGELRQAPPVHGTPGGSPVGESTAVPGTTPLRHGVAGQTPRRGRP